VTWFSTGAASCTGTGFDTANATSGSVAIMPVATTTYSISCTGIGGTTNAAVTVNVTPLPAVKFQVGDFIRTNTGGAPLNVRDSANGNLVGQQNNQALGRVTAGPVYVNSSWWWNVDYDADPDGWSAEDFLISDLPPFNLLPVPPSNPDVPL
jgi:hypothetical protein